MNYNRVNNYTQICFKNKFFNKMVSKNRSVTNLSGTTTVLTVIPVNGAHRNFRDLTLTYIIFTLYGRARARN